MSGFVVIPFACEPGAARVARGLARAVQRRIAGSGKPARFLPLVAEREGEIFFLNRRDLLPEDEVRRIAREQGVARVVDGRLGGADVEVLVHEATPGAPPVTRPFPLLLDRFFDIAGAIALWLAPVAGAGAKMGPPIQDPRALELFLEAEDLALIGYRSADEAAAARARRSSLLAEAAGLDPVVGAAIAALAGVGPRG